jgi:uncharacterized membrane protein YeaQ/YmgE (transglycosylase-associated protein family)
MSLLLSLAIGALAGFIATNMMDKSGNSLLINILLGIAGGLVGGFLFSLIGIDMGGFFGRAITSILGAMALIWAYDKFKK